MAEYKCNSPEEAEFLKNYDVSKYERPSVTADIVIFTIDEDDELNILLIRRGGYPYKGFWAIPGGFLDVGKESLDDAAVRELKEETNVDYAFLNQLYTFSSPDRDPRTTVISVAYTALVAKDSLNIKAGDDASDAGLFKITYDVNGLVFRNDNMVLTEDDLAFDHNKIIRTAILRLRNRIDYEPDAFNLLKDPKSFTISELKKIYETIKNKSLDLPNFRKSFLREYVATGKVTELEQTRNTKGRDAKLYRYNGGAYG